jgi:hypothetical protein
VKLTVVPLGWWGSLLAAITDHALTWPQAVVALGVLLALLTYRLLTERARRKTLTELVERSPQGTIVLQERGAGGPAMRIKVGESPGPIPRDGGPA